ncbi:hypothetical protein ANO14919_046440 [Xylariales sp. No.14919]|nr:hypothetical protein ANO14919_046440 [Xylariales sp. No.14919]
MRMHPGSNPDRSPAPARGRSRREETISKLVYGSWR